MPEVDFDINVTDLYDAIGRSDWDAASHACRSNPIQAETWVVRKDLEPRDGVENDGDNNAQNILWRFLPLHSACARRPPANFVRHLLRAYPEAASLKDESGMYPLHYACGNRASKAVIEELVDCFPLAAREADPLGMLPIHYIAQWGPSEDGMDVIELLLDEYPEGVTALNGEGMSPLDLCKEGNYDEWKEVLALLEEARRTKKKNNIREGSVGAGSHSSLKRMVLDGHEDSLISSTIEVRRSKKSPMASSLSRIERPSSRTRTSSRSQREERASSRTRRERSSSRPKRSSSRSRMDAQAHEERSSSRSKRTSSRGRADAASSTYYDARDEISTPRRYQYESRSITRFQPAARSSHSLSDMDRSGKPPSIMCSLASPRYHEMKTPRSSGRGPGFNFGQKTPRSTSSGRVEFDFENSSQSRETVTIMSDPQLPPSAINRPSSFQSQESSSQSSHRLNPPPSPSLLNHRSERENLAQGQMFAHLSKEKDNAQYQVSLLQNENQDLRAKLANYEMMQNEHAQLCAKLANFDTIQNENAQLRAKLANFDASHNENAQLRAKLDMMEKQNAQLHSKLSDFQEIQTQLCGIVDIAEQRESARTEASAVRRKMILEMLAVDERQEQSEQELGTAFGRHIRRIDGLRREIAELKMGGTNFFRERAMVDRQGNGAYP